MPCLAAVLFTRMAISPRFATSIDPSGLTEIVSSARVVIVVERSRVRAAERVLPEFRDHIACDISRAIDWTLFLV